MSGFRFAGNIYGSSGHFGIKENSKKVMKNIEIYLKICFQKTRKKAEQIKKIEKFYS